MMNTTKKEQNFESRKENSMGEIHVEIYDENSEMTHHHVKMRALIRNVNHRRQANTLTSP